MQNGSLSLGTVSDIKKHAKSFAEQTSKGYSVKTLIGSARSQIQRGQSADAAGHPKEALRAFYIAVTLASNCMDSEGGPSNEGSRSNREFLQFYQASIIHFVHHSNSMIHLQENMTSIVDRIKTLEAKLLDLERSSAA
jgi:ubiquitin carboxyl-terminal hydrolase 8